MNTILDIIFGHKWRYAKLMRDDSKDVFVRSCSRCNVFEHRKYHMGGMIWSGAIIYTDKGAKEYVEGFGEK